MEPPSIAFRRRETPPLEDPKFSRKRRAERFLWSGALLQRGGGWKGAGEGNRARNQIDRGAGIMSALKEALEMIICRGARQGGGRHELRPAAGRRRRESIVGESGRRGGLYRGSGDTGPADLPAATQCTSLARTAATRRCPTRAGTDGPPDNGHTALAPHETRLALVTRVTNFANSKALLPQDASATVWPKETLPTRCTGGNKQCQRKSRVINNQTTIMRA